MSDYDDVLAKALAAAGCQIGTLHLVDPAHGHLVLKSHVGLPDAVAQTVATVPIGKGMAGLAAQRREPVQTCDLQTDTSSDIRPGARAVPVQASVALPMVVDGQLVGVLGVAKASRHEWTESELAAMQALAATVAQQLDRR
jgi:GAF domain-containing protein